MSIIVLVNDVVNFQEHLFDVCSFFSFDIVNIIFIAILIFLLNTFSNIAFLQKNKDVICFCFNLIFFVVNQYIFISIVWFATVWWVCWLFDSSKFNDPIAPSPSSSIVHPTFLILLRNLFWVQICKLKLWSESLVF